MGGSVCEAGRYGRNFMRSGGEEGKPWFGCVNRCAGYGFQTCPAHPKVKKTKPTVHPLRGRSANFSAFPGSDRSEDVDRNPSLWQSQRFVLIIRTFLRVECGGCAQSRAVLLPLKVVDLSNSHTHAKNQKIREASRQTRQCKTPEISC